MSVLVKPLRNVTRPFSELELESQGGVGKADGGRHSEWGYGIGKGGGVVRLRVRQFRSREKLASRTGRLSFRIVRERLVGEASGTIRDRDEGFFI